ncbi:CPBP family intramembrane metalloprotease [Sedimentibacter sp. zth1]|nr:CPBP family intramembrane metalloprotease [Sedimentibacter sp. zth1]
MGLVDAVIRPQYMVKSIIKILLFLICPIVYSMYDKELKLKLLLKPNHKGLIIAVISGISVFTIIFGGYFLIGNLFDLSGITSSLTANIGVSKNNFLWVAIYISLVNSLLEEFFFRGFAFLTLKRFASRKFAYVFSSLIFAIYHLAMMVGWFDVILFILTISSLFIGGLIFDYFNEKYENIYISWLVHMFANFAINGIGFILFGIV